MAIVLEEKQQSSWKTIITVLLIIGFFAGGVYFLFFKEVPGIETIVPSQLKSTTELSKVQFDPAGVMNSDAFRALRRYAGQPSIGQVGRPNPFIRF